MVQKTASLKKIETIAREIKLTTLEISFNAHTGHVGSALSIADILTALYFGYANITPQNIKTPKRDYFILSKGHAAASLYATLFHKGIFSKKLLASFGQDFGLCEHPERHVSGIEMTSGSLGHGISFGMGVALGLKKKKLNQHVFVLISDGESNEGAVWEAALLAPKLELSNLMVIVDNNGWQCFGRTDKINSLSPLKEKWQSFGWETIVVDGHNVLELLNAFKKKTNHPKVIIANTITGKGIRLIEDQLIAHYKAFTKEEYETARKELSV